MMINTMVLYGNGGIKMVNNRNLNFMVMNYTNKISKTLNQTISEIDAATKTNSISHDFIKQIIPYQKFAIQVAEYTLNYTKHRQISSMAKNIYDKYPEIIKDMQEIKNISRKFKNRGDCISKYHKDFNQIAQHTFSELKKISYKQNINTYFLKLISIYFKSGNLLLQNLMKYRILPQLRLITEYMLCLNNQKLKEIKNIPQ